MKSLGTRNQIVARDKGNCTRHSATRSEIIRHLRDDHIENGNGLDLTLLQSMKPSFVPVSRGPTLLILQCSLVGVILLDQSTILEGWRLLNDGFGLLTPISNGREHQQLYTIRLQWRKKN